MITNVAGFTRRHSTTLLHRHSGRREGQGGGQGGAATVTTHGDWRGSRRRHTHTHTQRVCACMCVCARVSVHSEKRFLKGKRHAHRRQTQQNKTKQREVAGQTQREGERERENKGNPPQRASGNQQTISPSLWSQRLCDCTTAQGGHLYSLKNKAKAKKTQRPTNTTNDKQLTTTNDN